MSVTVMVPRVFPRPRFYLENDELEKGTGWQFRPGLSIRELFHDQDGYRVAFMRYSAGMVEPERVQEEDEHIFVLSGSLSDGNVYYAPGSYLLISAGMRPKLWSPGGCTLINHRIPSFKFGLESTEIQFNEKPSIFNGDLTDSHRPGMNWEELRPGVFMLPLFEGPPGNYKSALQRFLPGAFLPEHIHMGDEHVFILEGCQEDEVGSYDIGTYVFNPIGTNHQVWSEMGCLALVHWRAASRFLEDAIPKYR